VEGGGVVGRGSSLRSWVEERDKLGRGFRQWDRGGGEAVDGDGSQSSVRRKMRTS
jgi:hypothetical protein